MTPLLSHSTRQAFAPAGSVVRSTEMKPWVGKVLAATPEAVYALALSAARYDSVMVLGMPSSGQSTATARMRTPDSVEK